MRSGAASGAAVSLEHSLGQDGLGCLGQAHTKERGRAAPALGRRQGKASAGVVLGLPGPGLALRVLWGPPLRLPSAFVFSGSAVLLLLQANSCEAGRPPLLPGLAVAAKGVHASPKVTASCPVDECLSFLVEAAWAALQRRTWTS